MNVSGTLQPLAACAIAVCLGLGPAPASHAVCAPPNRGALVLVGGGANRPAFMDRFMQLAGGVHARIVLIPTALDDQTLTPDRMQRLTHPNGMAGVTATVLHTRDRNVANSSAFVRPLQD